MGNEIATEVWFPDAYDMRSGEFSLVRTDRAQLASQSFLDGRWERSACQRRRVKQDTIFTSPAAQMPRLNFIWHTGFCCSTLLAKALDFPGRNLSLCEPSVLVDVADGKRSGTAIPSKQMFELLAGAGETSEIVTVKPSPSTNCLLRDAVDTTAGQMLLLYSDCRSFVVSIAKMGEEGRKYVRRLYLALINDGHVQAKWPPANVFALSDLELASVVWHMQIAEFRRHSLGHRAASLNCEVLLSNSREILGRLAEFFSLRFGYDHVATVADGPLFQRNAKSGVEGFSTRQRREEHRRIEESLGADLDRIVEQSYRACSDTPRPNPLPESVL